MKLEGIKVLDLSMFLPGPHLTMIMADHGAEVVRIEPPAGEPTRSLGASQNGMTVWFRNTHRSKQSVVLDLKQPAAVEAFMRLAATADVVVEAFRPGVVDRLGIGPKAVRAVNPRLVYCSISAFGQTGPLAQRPAHDLSIAAELGIVALNRGNDGEPGILGMPAVDMASSLMALSGILMALLRRERTGQGDTLATSRCRTASSPGLSTTSARSSPKAASSTRRPSAPSAAPRSTTSTDAPTAARSRSAAAS